MILSAMGRACLFLALCLTLSLILTPKTFAQGSERSTKGSVITALPSSVTDTSPNLPSLDSIGPQTDVTIFLQSGVSAQLRRAALRRVWTVDRTIRDFRGLQESDWNFNDPDSIPGFGELGPEVDVEKMLAHIFGETQQLAANMPRGQMFDATLHLLQCA